jgi:ribose transport system substrate-binding protein
MKEFDMMRRSRRRQMVSIISLAAAASLVAACSSGSSESSDATESVTEETVTETAAEETADEAEEVVVEDAPTSSNALATAWEQDWVTLGLTNPGLAPTDAGIVEVDTSQFAKEGPFTIGFASQGPTNSWATIYDETLKARAAELGVTLEYAGADGKEDKQVNDINDLVAKGVDALIVTPMGPAIKAPIERAAAQGIPVILCTGIVDTDTNVSRVDRDNRLNGALSAEWIAQKVGGSGKIVMLAGIPGVPTAESRLEGANEVFAQYPDIEILDSQYTNWSPTEGKTVMEQMITKYGDSIDAIWSDSGLQNVGVIQAYREVGSSVPPITAEPLNGFLKLAKENNVEFAAIGYPPTHSADCLDTAIAALQGEPVSSFVNVDVPIFTDAEIDDYVRMDCSDDLWIPAEALSDELLVSLNLC